MANDKNLIGLTLQVDSQSAQADVDKFIEKNDGKTIKLNVDADTAKAASKIENLNIKSQIDTANIPKQIKSLNNQISKSTDSVHIPFEIDLTSSNQVQQEIEKIIGQMTNNQGSLSSYKIFADRDNNAYRVTLQYKNELQEVIKTTLNLEKAYSWIDKNGLEHVWYTWNEGAKQYSQNLEQVAAKTEKQIKQGNEIIRKRSEMIEQMNYLQLQAQKAGIDFKSENIDKFNTLAVNASSIEDIKNLQTYLKLAKTEFQELNTLANAGTRASAIERMGLELQKIPDEIALIEARFKSIDIPDAVNNRIVELRNGLEAVNNASDPKDKIAKYNELMSQLEALQREYQITAQEQKNLNQSISASQGAATLNNKIISWMSENRVQAQAFDSELKKIILDLQNVSTGADLSRLEREFRKITTAADAVDKTSRGFFANLKTDLGDALTNMLRYRLAYGIIDEVTASFKDLEQSVESLDEVLVELQKVTENLTDSQLEKIKTKAYEVGEAVAKTGTDTLAALAELKRSGFSIEESFDFAEDALKMVNVAENIEKASDSAKYLVGIMKGYNDTSKEFSSHILNSINEVSNTRAVTYDDLAMGAQMLSAVANQAHVSYEEMLSLLTGSNEVLNNMSKVANGWSTIFSRIQGIKLDTDEDAESVQTVSKLEEDIASATKGAVHVLDQQTGQLRDAYEIVRDLSYEWNNLDLNTQTALAEKISGKRQKSVFLSAIGNWESVEKAIDSAKNSINSAEEENAVYLQSIQGLRAEMESAKELFAQEMIDDAWIKDIISSSTNLLKVFTNLAEQDGIVSETIDTITSSLKLLTEGLEALSENDAVALLTESFITMKTITGGIDLFQSIKSSDKFQSLLNGLTQASSATEVLNRVIEENSMLNNEQTKSILQNILAENAKAVANGEETTSTEALIAALVKEAVAQGIVTEEKGAEIAETYSAIIANEAQEASIKGVTLATLKMIATNPATWVMAGITAANFAIKKLKELEKQVQETADSAEGFAKSMNSAFAKISSNRSELIELNDEYKELSKGVNKLGENVSLSSADYERYKEIISKVSSIMPELTSFYNAHGEAIAFTAGKLENLNAEYEKNLQLQAMRYLSKGDDEGNTFQDVLDNYANNAHLSDGTGFVKQLKARFGFVDEESVAVEDLLESLYFVQNKTREEIAQYLNDVTIITDANGIAQIYQDNVTIQKEALAKLIGSSYDILAMSDEEFNELQREIAQYISTYEQNVDVDMSQITSSLLTVAYSKDSFWNASDDARDDVAQFISSLNNDIWNSLQFDTNSANSVKVWMEKVIEAFASNQEFSKAWNELLSLDADSMSASDYATQVNKYIDTIANQLQIDESGREALTVSLGIDIDTSAKLMQGLRQKLQDSADSLSAGVSLTMYPEAAIQNQELDKWIFSLTEKELELANSTDFIQAVEKQKKQFDKASLSAKEYNAILKELKSTQSYQPEAISYVEFMSNVQALQEGFDKIDSIYSDVYNKEDFDWSSVLNNEDFSKVFEAYTEEYNAFIETVTNAPNDLEACQSAFDDLATAYLYGRRVLDDLTEDTKEATVAFLQQMGVSNALEIVEEKLDATRRAEALAAEILADNTYNLVEANEEEYDSVVNNINGLLNEANASDICRLAVFDLIAQQDIFGSQDLDFDDKVKSILKVAEAYLTTAQAASIAAEAQRIQWVVEHTPTTKEMGEKMLQDYISNFKTAKIDFKPVEYSGGDKTKTSKSSSNKSESLDSADTFDWIEVKIKRLQTAIEELDQTASATYKSWADRNGALASEMEDLRKEINLQQTAYEAYMKKAESISLPESYKELVRNGGIRIDTITDEKLAENINKYQEWYDKAIDAQNTINDLEDNLVDRWDEKMQMVAKRFSNLIAQSEHIVSVLDKFSDIQIVNGYLNSANYFTAMNREAENQKAFLEQQKAELIPLMQEALQNSDSEQYEEYENELNEIDESIADCDATIATNNSEIRKLNKEIYDLRQELKDNLLNEAKFIGDVLESASSAYVNPNGSDLYNWNGTFTKFGDALIETLAAQYDIAMLQADSYGKEAAKYLEQYNADPGNVEAYTNYWEYLEKQQSKITEAYGYQEEIINQVSSAYDEMLDHMKDVIDAYSKQMDEQKSLYDYQKSVTEKTNNISSLQKRLNALQGDTSEETRNTIQQLSKQLTDAQEDLSETEYDQWLNDQKKMLDNLYDNTSEWVNQRLDDTNAILVEQFARVNANSKENANTINDTTAAVGYRISDDMSLLINAETDVVSMYGADLSNKLFSVNGAINSVDSRVNAMIAEANNNAKYIVTNMLNSLNAVKTAIESKQLVVNVEGQQASVSGANPTQPVQESAKTDTTNNNVGTTPVHYYTAWLDGQVIKTGCSTEAEAKSAITAKGGTYQSTSGYNVYGKVVKHAWGVIDSTGKYINSTEYSTAAAAGQEAQRLTSLSQGKQQYSVKQRYAKGTRNAKQGLNLIGEAGMEAFVDNNGNIMLADSPILVPMEGGETVYNAKETKAMLTPLDMPESWKNFQNYMKSGDYVAPKPQMMNNSFAGNAITAANSYNNSQAVSVNDVNFNIQMYGVNDVESFSKRLEYELKNNSKAEKIIQSMTLGRALGGGSLIKNKY